MVRGVLPQVILLCGICHASMLGILTLILVLNLPRAVGPVVVLWEAQTQLAVTHSSTSQPGTCQNMHQEAQSHPLVVYFRQHFLQTQSGSVRQKVRGTVQPQPIYHLLQETLLSQPTNTLMSLLKSL